MKIEELDNFLVYEMNLANWLIESARKYPEEGALFKGPLCCATYKTFKNRVASIAYYLKSKKNIKKHDRVAIFMPNATEYLEIIYAVWFLGAVIVPINSKLHFEEVTWIIKDSGAKILFTGTENFFKERSFRTSGITLIEVSASSFKKLYLFENNLRPAKVMKNDLVWLFYTSGTTGKPKGVMLSSNNLLAMSEGYLSDVDTVNHFDTAIYAAPMSHGAGLYNIIFVKQGAKHTVPSSGRFDPLETLKLSAKFKKSCMFLAPTMVNKLVTEVKQSKFDVKGIRSIIYGGGPMYLSDINNATKVLGPRLIQIFGQGECPMAISVLKSAEVIDRKSHNWEERVSSVGKKQSVVEVVVEDRKGNRLPENQVGEICVYGPPVMLGYWNNSYATKKSVVNGWLKTGDLGRINSDGYITLEGRSKDLIISGGSNIYPREVEDVLLQHPNVIEASVVGKKDTEWGEIVVAFVVGKGIQEKLLDAFCLTKIARFKRPREYFFLDTLPKNNYGKISKVELRKRLADISC